MFSTKSFLCHLLLLAGCNYRVQNNQNNSPPCNSLSLNCNSSSLLQTGSAYTPDRLLEFLFAHFTKHFDLETLIKPREGMLNLLPIAADRVVEDAADNAILSLDGLTKLFSCMLNFGPTIDLLPTITDIRDRAAQSRLILTPAFDNFCSALLSTGSSTLEAMAKFSAAYAVCAFYSAYHAVAAADANIRVVAIDRVRDARAKAIRVAAIAVFGGHLMAAFVAEGRAVLHAACHTQPTHCNVVDRAFDTGLIAGDSTIPTLSAADRAQAAAHEAIKAFEAAHAASDLAVQAGATRTPAMVCAAEAAADRANAAAAQTSKIVCTIDANLHRIPTNLPANPGHLSALYTVKVICAEAAFRLPIVIIILLHNNIATYSNDRATDALRSAISSPN